MLYLTITPYKKYNYLPKFKLKTLDKKIVLNSMILKWDNVKKEVPTLINF